MTRSPLTNAKFIGKAIKKSDVTIRRWSENGLLPPPIVIGKNHFWDIKETAEALQVLGFKVTPTDFKEV